MHNLKLSLASLFKVKVSDINLQTVDGGLTHQSCICRVSGRRYFVKAYRLGGEFSYAVGKINQLTSYMRNRGVPASRLVLYSPEYPNIVIHEFVEAAMATGNFSQIGGIAKLYSQVALIGAEHGRNLSKPEYLSAVNAFIEPIRNNEDMGLKVDASIYTGTLKLAEKALKFLQASLPEQGLFHIHMHDDFTEKNILMDVDQVKLLCDWDSYRLKFLPEHLACTVCRFSTDRPLEGALQTDKLFYFLRSLDPKVLGYIPNLEEFSQLFPLLATLKHLRTYTFRNSLVVQGRLDLKKSLLAWPLEHCNWLMANHQQVSDWVWEALVGDQNEHISSDLTQSLFSDLPRHND